MLLKLPYLGRVEHLCICCVCAHRIVRAERSHGAPRAVLADAALATSAIAWCAHVTTKGGDSGSLSSVGVALAAAGSHNVAGGVCSRFRPVCCALVASVVSPHAARPMCTGVFRGLCSLCWVVRLPRDEPCASPQTDRGSGIHRKVSAFWSGLRLRLGASRYPVAATPRPAFRRPCVERARARARPVYLRYIFYYFRY